MTSRLSIFRFACIVLMLLAFAAKTAIPAGFMPTAASGFIEMVVCSGMGEKTVLVPTDDAPKHKNSPAKICDYQAVSSHKALPGGAVVILLDAAIRTIRFAPIHHFALTPFKAVANAARGPPRFV